MSDIEKMAREYGERFAKCRCTPGSETFRMAKIGASQGFKAGYLAALPTLVLTKEIVEKELSDCSRTDGEYPGLHSTGEYLSWTVGDDTICLDGHFILFRLQCICWYMENIK